MDAIELSKLNDWWTKYKPSEVKEDENITWEIDWDKMEAVYKESK